MDSVGQFLEDGDLVEFDRGNIQHWGIYDESYIIHVTGQVGESIGNSSSGNLDNIIPALFGQVNASVKREKLKDVASGCKFYKNNQLDEKYTPFSAQEIIRRARQEIGKEWNYYLLSSNCEHFASDMRYGEPISLQAWFGMAVAAGVTAGAVLSAGSIMTIKNKK